MTQKRSIIIGLFFTAGLLALTGCQERGQTTHKINRKLLPHRETTTLALAQGKNTDVDYSSKRKPSYEETKDSFQLPFKNDDLAGQFKLEDPNSRRPPVDTYVPKQPKKSSISGDASKMTNKDVQTALKQLGYYKGSVDGVMGKGTKSAIIKFQKSQGLKADGVAGTKTKSALLRATSGSSASVASASNSDIQRRLKELGYYKGPIDGVMGKGTKNAIIKFQKDQGLKADGVAGQVTKSRLMGGELE